ncbi:hypothetical protein GOP47_0009921 [Adiantum capillus-veneris]|uniref:Uncharacterized protein n=1 Tax=Adiantum capillus-veneris TaxID=13818 RepID=A0A9D4UXX8_ADICA|nr:hypothetical protein GOP47_0009921 [Adiantum capillus-veneris]
MDIDGVRRTFTTLAMEPFHSDTRRSGVATTGLGWGNCCVVHWRGAAEVILPFCQRRACNADAEGGYVDIVDFAEEERSKVQDTIAKMEERGLSCLALAYCEVNRASFEHAHSTQSQNEGYSIQNSLQGTDLTLLSVVGMKDTCREQARDHVRKAKEAGLRVIMVTGDSVAAARVAAEESGILDGISYADMVVGTWISEIGSVGAGIPW